MESLYRKYRPQTFDDVVGQQHVVTTLRRAVLEGRTSHAYLFCGPRGTGKTTMARLLAKALLCEQGEGHLPDGTCEECQLIAAGEHPDVYELDAASNTGVDNVREEIINRVGYAPVRGRYKVYIIDEVHMLTTAAFNALLKTLEEPPSHVVFVLCTTDPQKVLETILSRVQRFDFHAIGNEELVGRLAYVCEQEGFSYDQSALELICRHARGGMRDALTKLEQLATATGGAITEEVTQSLLGEVSVSTLSEVTRALAARDVSTLFSVVASLTEEGHDLLQFVHELAARLRDVYVVCAVGERAGVIAATGDDLQSIAEEAQAFGSPERLSRALAILADASTEMRVATNQRLVLELAFTRLAHPESDVTIDSLAERVAELERRIAQLEAAPPVQAAAPATAAAPAASMPPVQQAPVQHAPAQPAAQRVQPAQQAAPQQAAPRVAQQRVQQAPAQQPAPAQPAQAAAPQQAATPAQPKPPAAAPVAQPQATSQSAPQTSAPAAASAQAVTDPGELQRRWQRVCDDLYDAAPARGSLLKRSMIESDDGTRLVVSLPKGSTFATKMLDRPDVRAAIDPIVMRAFGHRSISYVESSLIEADLARADRAAAAKAATPARQAAVPAPAPTQQPSVPAPAPAPTPAPAPQPTQQRAPQPRPQAATVPAAPQPRTKAPAPQAAPDPSNPMPWDEEMPPYEEVPYDEADAAYFGEDDAWGGYDEGPAPAAPAQRPAAPVPTPAPQPKPQPMPPAQPAPVVAAPKPATPAAPAPAAVPTPTPAPQPASAEPAPAPQPQRDRTLRMTPGEDGLPDEASVYTLLTDVFGEGVNISREHAPDPEEDEYVDEPVDDADDE